MIYPAFPENPETKWTIGEEQNPGMQGRNSFDLVWVSNPAVPTSLSFPIGQPLFSHNIFEVRFSIAC